MNTEHSGERLRYALRASGKSPSDLAHSLRVSPQTINNWFARGVPGRQILTISKFLGVKPDWLQSGAGEPLTPGEIEDIKRLTEMSPDELQSWLKTRNLGRTRRASRASSYPEISWAEAGASRETRDRTDFDERARHSSDVEAGDTAFWLRVNGYSMMSMSVATFPEGSLILVDPDVQPESGRFVVARLKAENEAAFRQLVREAGDVFLKPLNSAFPIKALDDEWEVVGTVVDGKMPPSLFL